MKYLITGADGQLGRAVKSYARFRGYETLAMEFSQLDICAVDQVLRVVKEYQPDFVINCAAYTKIQSAELETERCLAVNADAVRVLATVCKQFDVELIHLSSDHVFSGTKVGQYYEDDEPDPVSVYGRSKLLGEQYLRSEWAKHVIVRSSWVFGEYGNNFFSRLLDATKSNNELRVPADQHGCPTYSHDLAVVLIAISEQLSCKTTDRLWGTYHYCGYDSTTWHKLALYILQENSRFTDTVPVSVVPVAGEENYQRPNSVLNCQKILNSFGVKQRPWKNGILKSLKAYYVDQVVD
ncbi:dTDP-4-dehydrorhamnose reductase [Gynuella sunshinyii]|uniref:dTDP-4-dehydrorhamnose reductase n=1 Tax=Gynuella sunshinyii YC6258 TaxID=1445510 RepID=A0A0C5VSW6_9GAMM|nr:dTDP-4-dehydrorhamnose reductase [Gynuella sunshinyii]AJQ96438.1 dTDP-4-dehydrorhamnose reductase [Gynuella sunshinyii YC6258]